MEAFSFLLLKRSQNIEKKICCFEIFLSPTAVIRCSRYSRIWTIPFPATHGCSRLTIGASLQQGGSNFNVRHMRGDNIKLGLRAKRAGSGSSRLSCYQKNRFSIFFIFFDCLRSRNLKTAGKNVEYWGCYDFLKFWVSTFWGSIKKY